MRFQGFLVVGLAVLLVAGCQKSEEPQITRLRPDRPKTSTGHDRAYYQQMKQADARTLQGKVKPGMTSENILDELGNPSKYGGTRSEGTFTYYRRDGTLTIHFTDARVTRTEMTDPPDYLRNKK